MARSALLNVMVGAVMKAGRTLARDFGEVENLQVSLKGPGDFVSNADRKAEKTLIEELSRVRPGYGFLTEESAPIEGTDRSHRWIIDPLDGTTNFLHGIPIFAVSVALERDGQIVAGVIFNPVMNELYLAEKGGGAFMNDRRLRVAARSVLADSVVATYVPHLGAPAHADFSGRLARVMMEVSGVRSFGSAALCLGYAASGRIDGYFEQGLQPWDMAAGLLILREAGGFVSDLGGGDKMFDTRGVCAGNEAIHRRLLGLLNRG